MSKMQPTARYSINRGQTLAHNLIATSRQPAPHILTSTIYFESEVEVMEVEAGNSEQIGRVHVEQGSRLWIVRSKFRNRYYLVANGQCSATDDRVAAACLAKVQLHQLQMRGAA